MPSTYTDGLGLELIPTGEQAGSWGATLNATIGFLEAAIGGYTSIELSGTTYALTVSDGVTSVARNRVIRFYGSPGGACTVTVAPNNGARFFLVVNACDETVILGQGTGATATVPVGKSALIYCDGAGAGAAVYNALDNLSLATLTASGAVVIGGALSVTGVASAATPTVAGNLATKGYVDTVAGGLASLTGSYANPAWIMSLANSKIAGLAASATTDTTNATNITTGSLGLARIAQGAAPAGQALAWNETVWAPLTLAASATVDTRNASNINSGSLALARIAQSGATMGQVLKWDGSAWAPSADLTGESGTETVAWGNITGTLGDQSDLASALSGKASSTHTHALPTIAISDVTGLQTALDGKAATSHTQAISTITGLQTALDGKAASSHTHTESDLSGSLSLSKLAQGGATTGQYLRWSGSAWAPATNTATVAWGAITGSISGQTDLFNALADKAAAAHTHTTDQVFYAGAVLTTYLNGLAAHNHSIGFGTTNLQYKDWSGNNQTLTVVTSVDLRTGYMG